MTADWKTEQRIYYIKSITGTRPSTCPECETELTIDHEQTYCPKCGLVCTDSIQYTAGHKICLPYGLKLG